MGSEIERKFLVHTDRWNQVKKPDKNYIKQGYLVADPGKTIRVRMTDNKGYITIKGESNGARRLEFEYEIPREDAQELLDKFAGNCVTKVRYKIPFKNKVWEVDEFLDDNLGLVIAEVELINEIEQFEFPDWIGSEVTGNEKYYNFNLSKNPFKNWKE